MSAGVCKQGQASWVEILRRPHSRGHAYAGHCPSLSVYLPHLLCPILAGFRAMTLSSQHFLSPPCTIVPCHLWGVGSRTPRSIKVRILKSLMKNGTVFAQNLCMSSVYFKSGLDCLWHPRQRKRHVKPCSVLFKESKWQKKKYMFSKDKILLPNIFDFQLVDSSNTEPTDMGGQWHFKVRWQ